MQNFYFLRSILTIFQPKSEIFPQETTGLCSFKNIQSLLNVCQHSDSITIQKVHISVIKTEDVKLIRFFDSFGVILESF